MLLSSSLWAAHDGKFKMLIGIVLKCKAPIWETKAHDTIASLKHMRGLDWAMRRMCGPRVSGCCEMAIHQLGHRH